MSAADREILSAAVTWVAQSSAAMEGDAARDADNLLLGLVGVMSKATATCVESAEAAPHNSLVSDLRAEIARADQELANMRAEMAKLVSAHEHVLRSQREQGSLIQSLRSLAEAKEKQIEALRARTTSLFTGAEIDGLVNQANALSKGRDWNAHCVELSKMLNKRLLDEIDAQLKEVLS